MYIVEDEGISGEFRLYFDYLSEGSNDFIGYRGLKTLFRRLPEIRLVTLNKLGTQPTRFWFLGNRPATP